MLSSLKDKKEYYRQYNSENKERKRIWTWNKRHPEKPIEYQGEKPQKRSPRAPGEYWNSDSYGNDKWKELGEADRQWRLKRMQTN